MMLTSRYMKQEQRSPVRAKNGLQFSSKHLKRLKDIKKLSRYQMIKTFWDEMRDFRKIIGDKNGRFDGIDNCWNNEPCFVIACSQALIGIDLNRLIGFHTITVNHLIEEWDKSEFHLFCDDRFIHKTSYDLSMYEGVLFHGHNTNILHNVKNPIRFVNRNISRDYVSQSIIDGLFNCQSGVAALNLAIITGANPIYLIGHDSTIMDKSEGDHYKKDYKGENVKGNYEAFEAKKKYWYGKFLQYRNRIINICNPDIAITFKDYFKTESFDEVMNKLQKVRYDSVV